MSRVLAQHVRVPRFEPQWKERVVRKEKGREEERRGKMKERKKEKGRRKGRGKKKKERREKEKTKYVAQVSPIHHVHPFSLTG